jgi:hypothetical protein
LLSRFPEKDILMFGKGNDTEILKNLYFVNAKADIHLTIQIHIWQYKYTSDNTNIHLAIQIYI